MSIFDKNVENSMYEKYGMANSIIPSSLTYLLNEPLTHRCFVVKFHSYAHTASHVTVGKTQSFQPI